MKEFASIEDVLEFAIASEEEAYRFYTSLGERVTEPEMRAALKRFAGEELGHKAKLQRLRAGGDLGTLAADRPIPSMADYLVPADTGAEMDYQDALIVAMKREQAAARLYQDMATRASAGSVRELFERLAAEEQTHRQRFETEYDNLYQTEN